MTEIQMEHPMPTTDHPTERTVGEAKKTEEPSKADVGELKRQILEDLDDGYIGRSDA